MCNCDPSHTPLAKYEAKNSLKLKEILSYSTHAKFEFMSSNPKCDCPHCAARIVKTIYASHQTVQELRNMPSFLFAGLNEGGLDDWLTLITFEHAGEMMQRLYLNAEYYKFKDKMYAWSSK